MKRRGLLTTAFAALASGACTSTQGSGYGVTTSSAGQSDGDYSRYYALMRPGQLFIGDTIAFDLNLVVVPNSTQLVPILAGKKDWSDEADPIYDNLKAGKIPAFKGQTSATFYLNLVGSHLPQRLFYLNAMRCMGMVDVQRSSLAGY